MAHYPDLSPCDYFGFDPEGKLLAVGWLEPAHPYSTGKVDQRFLNALAGLLSNPWKIFVFRGRHVCSCRRFPRAVAGVRVSDYAGAVQPGNLTGRSGWLNLFVPGKRRVYVAPELIMHYIQVHEYCPPKAFQEAVLTCPTILSTEYLQAIAKKGPRPLAEKAAARLNSQWRAKLAVEALVDEGLVKKEHFEKAVKITSDHFV